MDKRQAETLCPMNPMPQPPLINTQLQLGAGRPNGTANRFNGLRVASATTSAAERLRELSIPIVRSLEQTVETVSRPRRALHTQLELGVNERGGRTGAGISNMTIFTNSGNLL